MFFWVWKELLISVPQLQNYMLLCGGGKKWLRLQSSWAHVMFPGLFFCAGWERSSEQIIRHNPNEFPHFHNPASLAELGFPNNSTSWHIPPPPPPPPLPPPTRRVTRDSLFEQIVSTQIRSTNISYYGLRGIFPWRITSTAGWKALFRLARKGSDQIQSLWSNRGIWAGMWPWRFICFIALLGEVCRKKCLVFFFCSYWIKQEADLIEIKQHLHLNQSGVNSHS